MKLTRGSVEGIILKVIENLNLEREPDNQVPVGVDTVLFGSASALDSLALVSVIADVEMAVSEAAGEPISLMDDRALSQEQSPFTDVRALTAYILKIAGGEG